MPADDDDAGVGDGVVRWEEAGGAGQRSVAVGGIFLVSPGGPGIALFSRNGKNRSIGLCGIGAFPIGGLVKSTDRESDYPIKWETHPGTPTYFHVLFALAALVL